MTEKASGRAKNVRNTSDRVKGGGTESGRAKSTGVVEKRSGYQPASNPRPTNPPRGRTTESGVSKR